MRELIRFLLRGALGAVALPLFMTVYDLLCHPYYRLFILQFMALLLVPAGIGAAIGFILFLINRKTKIGNGLITRLVVGVILATLLCALYVYFFEYPPSYVTLREVLLSLILAGLEIGTPAAILARVHDKEPIVRLNLAVIEVKTETS